MAELPDAGKHCSVVLCNKFDFTPFTCRRCGKFYCGLHRFEHGCSVAINDLTLSMSSDGSVKREFSCSVADCATREFVQIQCSHCKRDFCLSHRQCEDHNCEAVARPILIKETSTREAVVAEQSKANLTIVPRRPLTAEEQARLERVAVMQLKMKNSLQISVDQQLFLFAVVQNDMANAEWSSSMRTALMLSKFWTIGKSLDVIAKQLALDVRKRWVAVKITDNGENVELFPSDDLTKHFRDRDGIIIKLKTC